MKRWRYALELRLARWRARYLFRRALQRAYLRFAERLPCWANSLFDEHFLKRWFLPRFSQDAKALKALNAAALVWGWAEQFPYPVSSPARLLADLEPVAAVFLDLLRAELKEQVIVFQPSFADKGKPISCA